jgi:para-aminobenzoate synthetase/4-amino-4-deoxychorismate lyase
MKGTWPRGGNFFSDMFAGLRLHYDEKNRAENLMITDLLRNDLGRCGNKIHVPKLFEVARYNLLYQMTSTVTARVQSDIPLYTLFSSLFPSGSVTGTPKIRAMQIIRELETEERKIYTGAIGYILPNKNMFFNIPIRTLLLQEQKGEMGIGGGIVWDSTAQGEWDEGMLKGNFLTQCTHLKRKNLS